MNNVIGKLAEQFAEDYFREKGHTILYRNWRHGRFEIDIIATKDEILHFIEVKSLSSSKQVYPEVHVTPKKFQSLKKAASRFLSQHPKYSQIQFDILSIVLNKDTAPEFFLIEDVYL